ncbi:protein MpBHLH13 [Marchantia polymorpha subsp. ruderalis]|uniref:BHLH domain-containing protein n=1 Tax=Marchantia polymorpha TaxID=3197 RepID=A0A2R6X2Y2_MARPO|nr:hypothetical protein MARPO_0040s0112 [Marchantia polymorpha]BBN03131.1 hypothetical protein Mp_2g20990 [Marchantia polymorpha subsp. ruderalis]|eukprot:PTQ40442.1 hypothetical protein MARPO_0040s0112 [Marchantia polymorpha]
MSSPSNNSKWISFLAQDLLEVEEPQPFNAFQWCTSQSLPEQGDCSAENDGSKADSDEHEKICPRKRSRDESCSGAGSKACREKMRRDRLNDRFVELSSALEPGRPPKSDKATILCDAVRILNQLRSEAQELKDSNHLLREAIKDLKAEKNELRDEKLRLKADKERLEQQLKTMTIPYTHPATLHAAAAFAQAQAHATTNKASHMPGYPGMAMWQWMPQATVDTSQDHVLRPPVA